MESKFPLFQNTDESSDTLESRKERLLNVTTFLRRLGIESILQDTEKKKKFIENLSFNTFKDLLIKTNGFFRDIDSKGKSFDGETDVRVMNFEKGTADYCPPVKEDKEKLLNDAYSALKRMGPSRDSAAMLGTAITAIHPFFAANGRTARLTFTVVASSKNELLANDVTPDSIQPFIEYYVKNKIYNRPSRKPFAYTNDLQAPDVEKLEKKEQQYSDFTNFFVFDGEVLMAAMDYYFFKKNIDFGEKFLKKDNRFSLKNFLHTTTCVELDGIISEYRNFKVAYVHALIDSFEHPAHLTLEKVIPPNSPGKDDFLAANPGLTLKDLFFFFTSKRGSGKITGSSWNDFINYVKSAK